MDRRQLPRFGTRRQTYVRSDRPAPKSPEPVPRRVLTLSSLLLSSTIASNHGRRSRFLRQQEEKEEGLQVQRELGRCLGGSREGSHVRGTRCSVLAGLHRLTMNDLAATPPP